MDNRGIVTGVDMPVALAGAASLKWTIPDTNTSACAMCLFVSARRFSFDLNWNEASSSGWSVGFTAQLNVRRRASGPIAALHTLSSATESHACDDGLPTCRSLTELCCTEKNTVQHTIADKKLL